MSDFSNAGVEVGDFLGGVLNPIFGSSTTTTTTQQGTGASGATSSTSNKTTTVLIIVFIAVSVLVIGYFLLKNRN